ncbi:MAG: hypothetical protein HOK17_05175, partial [Flammeovirgaceae bacterium]|nr:hypothetical protein [Flammeovirgaceae bacterium]
MNIAWGIIEKEISNWWHYTLTITIGLKAYFHLMDYVNFLEQRFDFIDFENCRHEFPVYSNLGILLLNS